MLQAITEQTAAAWRSFLKPSLFQPSFSIVKAMLRAITEQMAAEWRSSLKPSLFRPSFSIVKNRAPGHHQANGRRVTTVSKSEISKVGVS